MRNNKICLPELPIISYNVSYINAYGSTEKRTVQVPIEVIQALENISSQVKWRIKAYWTINRRCQSSFGF